MGSACRGLNCLGGWEGEGLCSTCLLGLPLAHGYMGSRWGQGNAWKEGKVSVVIPTGTQPWGSLGMGWYGPVPRPKLSKSRPPALSFPSWGREPGRKFSPVFKVQTTLLSLSVLPSPSRFGKVGGGVLWEEQVGKKAGEVACLPVHWGCPGLGGKGAGWWACLPKLGRAPKPGKSHPSQQCPGKKGRVGVLVCRFPSWEG